MKRGAGALLAALVVLGSAGCARQGNSEVKGQLEVIQKEQTWQRLYERGKAFASIGDHTRAEQYLAASLEAGGTDPKIIVLLMGVCVESKKYRVAVDYGEAHLKNHPGDVKLRHLMGTLYLALGEAPQAKKQFAEALRRNPNEAETHYALAVLYRDTDHDLPKADEHFREYLRIQPTGARSQEARASLLKAVP